MPLRQHSCIRVGWITSPAPQCLTEDHGREDVSIRDRQPLTIPLNESELCCFIARHAIPAHGFLASYLDFFNRPPLGAPQREIRP
jgi:hypothetical protein